MATASTGEAKELNLVSKVELRIALTDSDEKLETILKTYLPPLLLKLRSEWVGVRNKVISILQHVNTRIKPPSIKLPLSALLKQFKDPNSTSLIRHFDLLYIQQGIGRISPSERVELLPTLIHGIASDAHQSPVHGAGVFNLLLRILPFLSLPSRGSKEDGELREKLGLAQRLEDVAFVAEYLGKLVLLTIVRSNAQDGTRATRSCPSLSLDDYIFLTLEGKKDTWDSSSEAGISLTESKVAACKFLASGAFTDEERFFPALFAAADSNSVIAEIGDGMMKRSGASISMEEARSVERLFQIYFGDSKTGSPPARPSLQTRILGLLSRSVAATTYTQHIIRLVVDGVIPTSAGTEGAAGLNTSTGREASKLRGAIFTFTNWVARMGCSYDLQQIAPRLVYTLRDYIESQGWPKINDQADTAAEVTLRGYAYEIVGLLAKTSPAELLLDPNIDLVRWLFTSLSADSSGDNIPVSIGEALGGVLQAMSRVLDEDVARSLRALLLQHMNLEIGQESPAGDPYKVHRSTRFIAVRYATRCLSYSDVVGRWICLLAIGGKPNERNEVVEEGKKGLDPYWYRMLNPPKDGALFDTHSDADPRYRFPKFSNLVRCFFTTTPDADSMEVDDRTIVANFDGRMGVFGPAVAYARRILWTQAVESMSKAMEVDVDWEQRLDAAVSSDETVRGYLRHYLSSLSATESDEDRQAFSILLGASYEGLCWNEGEGIDPCGEYFVELCAFSRNRLLEDVVTRVRDLEKSALSNIFRTRSIAAHAFGILASHPACLAGDLTTIGQKFLERAQSWRVAIGTEANKTHGSILALAYLASRLFLRDRKETASSRFLVEPIPLVLDILVESKDNTLQEAAISAIDQLSTFGNLSPAAIPSPHTGKTVVDCLLVKAKTGNEKAILALGHFAMNCEEDDSLLDEILSGLYQLHEQRQAEVQFTVGDALGCAASGWQSTSLMNQLDIDSPRPEAAPRTHTLARMLDKILKDCRQTKPALRKASSIWLLCLIQAGGHLREVQERLRRCQAAFKGFLADRDELVQESASRGLTLIYEKGDRALKDDLVRDLVSSFTGTNTSLAGNVDEETELFEPGALPTGDGSVATYKDIMSLATEVGDPSLVYRFMSMASSNAIWSSRAAFGRFGLGNILSESSVDGYLAENSKLYPKLYRYRFDPNTKVQKSMNDIWTALVKDPSAVIDKYFDDIMDDLLKSILGKEWRVRQASCAAIADLVQGRPLEKYEKYLGPIWTASFKVLDDIKESVRAAAMSLCRVLTGMLVRSVEAGSSSQKSRAMLDNVVPFLMSPAGLEASAQEVQMFALDTILRLAKTGTKALRPFVPSLIERLLGLLSTLEPEAVNYLHLNASKYNLTEDKIDEARLKSVRSSPMMDAIEKCLDILDEESMTSLVQHLESAMKQAVGMPSKVGCSRILVSLSTRHNFLFRPHAGTFLKAIQKTVLDRNDAVASSYAAAAGYLARLASDKAILQLLDFAQKLYFEMEEERHRVTSGELVYAMSKHATDRFASLGSAFLPFVFVAKHDTQEPVKELYEKTWSENVGGTRSVLLYLQEIVDLAAKHLDSARWAVKHAAALSIADAATSGSPDLDQRQQEIVWPALDRALNGRSWEGKERVLEAYVAFARSSPQLQEHQPEATARMQKQILVESKRKNASYRQSAIVSLGKFVEGYDKADLSEAVLDIVTVVIGDLLGDEDEMDIDAGSAQTPSKTSRQSTIANAIRAGFQSINPAIAPQQELIPRITRIAELAERAKTTSPGSDIHIAISDGVITLARAIKRAPTALLEAQSDARLMPSLLSLVSPLADGSISERTRRAEAAEELAALSDAGSAQLLQRELTAARAAERDRAVRAILERALGHL